MTEQRRCCGTCKYNEYYIDDFACNNEESDSYAINTMYDDCCDEYEEEDR